MTRHTFTLCVILFSSVASAQRVNVHAAESASIYGVQSTNIHGAHSVNIHTSSLRNASFFKGAELMAFYGPLFMNSSKVNPSLAEMDLPSFGTTLSRVGAGGGVFINRLYFGGHGAWLFGPSGSNDMLKSRYTGGTGVVKVGYTVVHTPALAVYPSIGIGGGGSSVHLSAAPEYTEPEIPRAVAPGDRLHSAFMVVEPGINLDIFPGHNSGSNSTLVLGIQAGYTLTPFLSWWENGNTELPSMKKFGPEGFYVQVKAGWHRLRQ